MGQINYKIESNIELRLHSINNYRMELCVEYEEIKDSTKKNFGNC